MEAIHIGTQNCSSEVRERLDFELRFLEEEGIKVNIAEDIKGSITFFDCNIPDGDALFQINSSWLNQSTRDVVIHYIANALADIIVGNLEHFFVSRIIENSYDYFDSKDRQNIFDKALIHLNNFSPNGGIHYLPQIERKERILTRILTYLQDHDQLIIEGFIRFRLKDYFQELELAVDQAVEDFMMEKEYKEFIRLLKYFVDIQEPKVAKVNIVQREEGIFRLLDSEGRVIDNEYLEGIILQMVDSDIDYEDLLISALISIAPAQIVVHFSDNPSVVETLESIFESRVSICSGCSLCQQDAGAKKE